MKSIFIKKTLLGIIFLAALGAVVMFLWNLLIPGIFGLSVINFWQALGLFVLARILFGRFGFGGRRMMSHDMAQGRMENPIHDKWRKMTPEQRKAFIDKRRKFGFGFPCGREPFGMEDFEDGCNENERTGQ